MGYDPETKSMDIEFRSGNRVIYRYSDVPEEEYLRLWNAESKGKHFHKNIAGKFKFQKIALALHSK